jgi:TrmH family RNA methyltransferase
MQRDPLSAVSVQQLLARVRALAHRRARDNSRQFWVEGIRQFVQAFDAHAPFDTVVYSPVLLKSSLAEMLSRRLAARGVRRVTVTPEQFRSVSIAERASGIGAIVRQHWTPLSGVVAGVAPGDVRLVFEDIRSPGNLGTILRTAEATGVAGAMFLSPGCDPFDPAVVRASMGGMFHLALTRTTHAHLRRWADANGVTLVGLSPDAPRLWTDLPSGGSRVALMIGEERQGLTSHGRAVCHELVRLPMSGRADSLNVGVAAGVMMYEMVRRGVG